MHKDTRNGHGMDVTEQSVKLCLQEQSSPNSGTQKIWDTTVILIFIIYSCLLDLI